MHSNDFNLGDYQPIISIIFFIHNNYTILKKCKCPSDISKDIIYNK